MLKYSLQRVTEGILILFIVSLITFFVLKIIPADPAVLILGTEASPESLEALRESMGLNKPYIQQYIEWISGVLRGDLGESYYFGQSVSELIMDRMPVTLSLAIGSMLLTFIIAMVLGVIAALAKDSWLDLLIRFISQLSAAMPSFWIGMMFLSYFAAKKGWFQVAGSIAFKEDFLGSLKALVLPCIVMTLTQMSGLIRQFRASMSDALDSDFMLAAEIKGLSRFKMIFKYALRSAMVTPITVASLQFAGLFGGTAVIETVFSLPGLGRLLVVSVEQRDMVLLQGIIIFITLVVVVISILTDIVYGLLDKRMRRGEG